MIYTLTFSPSIDYYMNVPMFKEGFINRSNSDEFVIGGKGINVTKVIKELGMKSIAIGFIGDFTGDYLKSILDQEQINYQLIKAKGHTRINVKIISNNETAINSNSLIITNNEMNELYKIIESLNSDDYLVISGSVPNDINFDELYNHLDENVKVILDVDYNIRKTLCHKPFMIKPNRDELGRMFNTKIESVEEAISCAKILKKEGAINVIVSLDKEGALLIDKNNKIYYNKGKEIKVKSTVGAGDSLVAGFLYNYVNSNNIEESFKYGIICSQAACLTNALPTKLLIEEVKEK